MSDESTRYSFTESAGTRYLDKVCMVFQVELYE